MKAVYYITGTGSGIGRALAVELLKRPDVQVIGISRSNSIAHENFEHRPIDLSVAGATDSVQFDAPAKAQSIALVNNAGTLGEVGPVGSVKDSEIEAAFQLNTIAPAILTNRFVAQLYQHSAHKMVLNVSSGAGKYPIDGWATYCASKAGLDMFALVAGEESRIGRQAGFQFWSVAPGVVDTPMQAAIRQTDPSRFANHQRFIEYHQTGALESPESIAIKYLKLLDAPANYPEVLYSLRDF